MNDFLLRLKEELDYQGLTQKDLAAKTGISVNTLHSWFSKDIIPPLDSAYKVAQVINQPLEYLIAGDVFTPNNYNLPTREIKLLDNYRKLQDKEKTLVDNIVTLITKDFSYTDKNSIF